MITTGGKVLCPLTLNVFHEMLVFPTLKEYFSFNKEEGFYHKKTQIFKFINSWRDELVVNPIKKASY